MEINLLAPAYRVTTQGVRSPDRRPGPPTVAYFYARYISGTTLTNATFFQPYNGIVENCLGTVNWQAWSPPAGERHLSLSNGNNSLSFSNMALAPDFFGMWRPAKSDSELAFGCGLQINSIYDKNGNESHFFFNSVIKKVVASEPLNLNG